MSYGFHKVEGKKDSLFDSGLRWTVYYTTPIVYQSRNVGILLVSVSIQDVMDQITRTQTNFGAVSVVLFAVLILFSF